LDKLDLSPYDGQLSAALAAAQERSVSQILCVSIDLDSFGPMYSQVRDFEQVDCSLGVHPLHVKTPEQIASVEQLKQLVAQHPKVVAIGETGLDYYYDAESRDLQWQSFANHLLAAGQLELPVIVHTRDAREDTLKCIREYGAESGGVLHCFTESAEMASAALDMNYYISFSGIATFRNADALREVIKLVPLERILIETDAPYLAPVPYRGKKNEPKYVVEVAQCVADLKGLSLAALAEKTAENYYRLFNKATRHLG